MAYVYDPKTGEFKDAPEAKKKATVRPSAPTYRPPVTPPPTYTSSQESFWDSAFGAILLKALMYGGMIFLFHLCN